MIISRIYGRYSHAAGISIGIAEIDPGKDTVEAGLKKADQAIYRAKEEGRNRVMFFL